jgi:hypothetical protein
MQDKKLQHGGLNHHLQAHNEKIVEGKEYSVG